MWLSDPPEIKKCHFIDVVKDAIRVHGVTIEPVKEFWCRDWMEIPWGNVSRKTNEDIAEKVFMAHQTSRTVSTN